ncbi:uncharacterized protein LOC132707158 [Cylas formicarius]|uniref:uncharacterized protein LOC132707158 n=1 Tax=Cylas formicarius TaxID=197179 RepID=UPI00295870BB|nr:uncharacterized protein LOC132707158 [Cylas formicarius]
MEQRANQTTPLWNKSTTQGRLRPPKLNNSTEAVAKRDSSNSQPDSVVANSTLKADAPEFYPAGYNRSEVSEPVNYFPKNVHITVSDPASIVKHSAQNRLNKYKQNSIGSSYVEYNGHCDDDSPDMIRLKQIISSLKLYPGQFDDLLMVFMETIYPYFNDIIAMSEIVKLLVSEAIESANFRYNSARLCWYVEQKCAEFRAELHMRCKKELQENPNQQNVLLFLAELYTQLPHSTLYGTLLIDSLKRLLESGGNDNVKCVAQALKLTGYSLDQTSRTELDEVFSQLRFIKNSLSGSTLMLLNSVINLRESNWGRMTSETSSDSSEFDEPHYDEILNGVMYETEGQVLTNEEREFLMANATHDEYIIDNEDPDALCDPEPEMDEEIRAAFSEFVKLSKG